MSELQQQMIERFERIPFQKYLGLKLESFTDEEVICTFRSRPELLGHEARQLLHGGVIASAIDSVGGFVAGHAAGIWLNVSDTANNPVSRLSTIDMRIDYLSPGRGSLFSVRGFAQKTGRRFVSTRMDLTSEDDELIATGTANFLY